MQIEYDQGAPIGDADVVLIPGDGPTLYTCDVSRVGVTTPRVINLDGDDANQSQIAIIHFWNSSTVVGSIAVKDYASGATLFTVAPGFTRAQANRIITFRFDGGTGAYQNFMDAYAKPVTP
jgi:hypothetical protein